MTVLRRLAFTTLAASAALALTACGSKEDTAAGGGAPTGGPVAPVAAPAGQMWSDVVSATPEGGMRMGNPNAPIKLVEYGSLSCPHCARLSNQGMKTLVGNFVNSGRVSYEFRSFIIHGAIDVMLTQLAQCGDKSTFFPLIEQLYATQDQWIAQIEKNGNAVQAAAQNLPPQQRFAAMADGFGLTDWFAARGISKDQAHACLADTNQAQKLAAQTQAWSSEQGIDSTPTLFINGSKLELPGGEEPWDALNAALQNAGAR
jgi:protein-disulfide isomerase